MLPDFVAIKREVQQIRQASVSLNLERVGLSPLFPPYFHHEGNRFTIFRKDGSYETSHYKSVKSEFTIDMDDLQSRGERAIREAFSTMQNNLAESTQKLIFDTISTTVEAIGNSIDAKGQKLTAELILDAWDKIESSFDDKDNWLQPTIIVNPVQGPRVDAELRRIETEPDLRKRKEEIIALKRKEWNVREANRKLVD